MSKYQEKMFETDPHGSSIFCIPALPKHRPVEVDNTSKSFDFGSALESYYPLLEFVFEYLEVSDLKSAKLINPTWYQLAERELLKRNAPTWISFCYNPSLCLRVSPGFRYHTAAIGIIAYNPSTVKLEKYICLHDSPDFNRMSFAEYIGKEVVPTDIDYCTIACSEVARNVNEEKCRSCFYQGIFIPTIPNIRVAMFHCSPKQVDLSQYINSNESIKCVLMFSQKYRVKVVETFLSRLLEGQKPRSVALGGGLILSTKRFTKERTKKLFLADDLFCITFLQEKNAEPDFNAYSTVINSDNVIKRQYEKFEIEVTKLKDSSVLRSNGVVFRFCCCAKIGKEKEKETGIIAKYFPKYPILGLEVEGEVGWNTSDLQEEQPETANKSKGSPKAKRQKVTMPQTLHGWSTVLVLITWGKKI